MYQRYPLKLNRSKIIKSASSELLLYMQIQNKLGKAQVFIRKNTFQFIIYTPHALLTYCESHLCFRIAW